MKSNNLTLCLLGKHPSNNTYKVQLRDKTLWLSKEKIMKEIRVTSFKARNCTIRDGNIVMKPGFGEMRLIVPRGSALKIKSSSPKASVNKDKTVHIVTRMEHKNTDSSIYIVDSYFSNHIAHRFEFLKENFSILKKIDRVKNIYQSFDVEVKTQFGVTNIENISSSCKCVLCGIYLLGIGKADNVTLNTDEAGDTAFNLLCSLVAGTKLKLHTSVYRDSFALEKAGLSVLIDGEPMEDPMDLIDKVVLIEGD